VENQNFEMRKNVLKYDEVMNEQRKVIYRERREILESADIAANIQAMIDEDGGAEVVCHYCENHYDYSVQDLEAIIAAGEAAGQQAETEEV